MGGTKPTMDGLRAVVRANAVGIRANDKDTVRVDVVWNQESVNDARHYAGMKYRLNLGVSVCVYTHIDVHTHIRASPTTSPRRSYAAMRRGVP